MFYRAQQAGLLVGLGNFHNTGKVLNLHFADDTLLFFEADTFIVENLKFLLLGLESLYGLKINFDKSELIALNLSDLDASYFANQLGCKLSSLPITYLRVPLH